MFVKQEAEKWYLEIEEKRQDVQNKREFLLKQEKILNMKIEFMNRLSDKLKTDLLTKLKDELKKVESEIDRINDIGHDLALLSAHVEANFNIVK